MLELVGYSDYICPFCFFGTVTMEAVLQDYDARLEWRGFEIHPEVPDDGVPIELLDPRMLQGLKKTVGDLAVRHNVPVQLPSRLPNSRRALLGGEFAREAGNLPAYHHAVFEAYFVDDRDIGTTAVLQMIAAEVGLDAEAFGRAVTDRVAEPTLEANRHECTVRGITGVPTWIVGNRLTIVGAQPVENLRHALDQAQALLNAETGAE